MSYSRGFPHIRIYQFLIICHHYLYSFPESLLKVLLTLNFFSCIFNFELLHNQLVDNVMWCKYIQGHKMQIYLECLYKLFFCVLSNFSNFLILIKILYKNKNGLLEISKSTKLVFIFVSYNSYCCKYSYQSIGQ